MQEVWVLVTCFWTSTVESETKDLRFGLAGCHSWSWLLSENRAGNAGVRSQVPMVWLESQFNFDTCWDIIFRNILTTPEEQLFCHTWDTLEKKTMFKKWRRTICDILLLHSFIGCKISVVSGFGMAPYIAEGYLWSIYVSSAVLIVHHPKQTKRILHTTNKSVCRRRWPGCSARVGPAHGICGRIPSLNLTMPFVTLWNVNKMSIRPNIWPPKNISQKMSSNEFWTAEPDWGSELRAPRLGSFLWPPDHWTKSESPNCGHNIMFKILFKYLFKICWKNSLRQSFDAQLAWNL